MHVRVCVCVNSIMLLPMQPCHYYVLAMLCHIICCVDVCVIISPPTSVSVAPESLKATELLKGFINQPFKATDMVSYENGRDLYKRLVKTIRPLSLVDLNFVLYYCDKEQRVYNVPGYGPLTYCGLQGE